MRILAALVEIQDLAPWFWPGVVVILGGVFGSFFSCVLYRLPRGESLRTPGSHCPSCHTLLGTLDLVPILSFLFLRGRCRHCKVKMGIRYVLIEVSTVMAGLLGYFLVSQGVGQIFGVISAWVLWFYVLKVWKI